MATDHQRAKAEYGGLAEADEVWRLARAQAEADHDDYRRQSAELEATSG